MSLPTAPRLILVDEQDRQLGHIEVESTDGELLLGRFEPGHGFAAVAPLFRDFEEAANSQALSVVDKLETAIASLGLFVRFHDGSRSVNLHDVQIWSDGSISCRLRQPLPAGANGSVQEAQPRRVGTR